MKRKGCRYLFFRKTLGSLALFHTFCLCALKRHFTCLPCPFHAFFFHESAKYLAIRKISSFIKKFKIKLIVNLANSDFDSFRLCKESWSHCDVLNWSIESILKTLKLDIGHCFLFNMNSFLLWIAPFYFPSSNNWMWFVFFLFKLHLK